MINTYTVKTGNLYRKHYKIFL